MPSIKDSRPRFDYTGTRDNSNWLAVPAALDYLEELGLEAMRTHNDALAEAACELLVARWGTEAAAGPALSRGDGLSAAAQQPRRRKRDGKTSRRSPGSRAESGQVRA